MVGSGASQLGPGLAPGLLSGEATPWMTAMTLRWEKALYGRRAWFTDVDGVGRYLIERIAQTWVVRLNGNHTPYYGDTLEQAQQAVERAVAQRGSD